MSAVDWDAVAELFAETAGLSPRERSALLAERCRDRPEVRAAVERLLLSRDACGEGFLASLPSGLVRDAMAELDAPPPRLGAWRALRELGQGGMGQVFLAERVDGQFTQRAALKLLKRGMDSRAILARFLRERQILAGLEHPNIARLLDGGIAPDGRPFFVMEYVEGLPLTRYADEQQLSIAQRLTLFQHVCLAVEYAHRNLVIHRDLKPSNILVTADGEPKLLDFGIARLLASDGADATTELTEAGRQPLTPEYAAPEQLHGGAITTSTDVYGLGALLYELLAGCRPGSDAAATLPRNDREPLPVSIAATRQPAAEQVAGARSSEPNRLRRRLTGDLDVITATALRSEPDRRYPSVGALRDDIERHQQRLPVTARPDSAVYRTSRFIRRHRAGAALTAVIVFLALAYGLTVQLQARALARERDRAQREAVAARQVSDFLVGVFEVADPTHSGMGDTIRARTLLDQGAERVQLDLAGQPLIMARMLNVIGRAYDNLSRSDLAEALLQRALALQRQQDVADPALNVGTLRQLSRARLHLGDYDGAREALGEAIVLQRALGPAGLTMWELTVELADVFHGQGQRDSVEATARHAMLLFDSIPVRDFTESRAMLSHMTELLGFIHDSVRLEAVHRRLVDVAQAVDGPRSAAVATAYSDWGESRRRRGDLAGAEPLLERALRLHNASGTPSPALARTLTELAEIAAAHENLARADSLMRAAIAIYRT
ncbi:MAG TPA: serine/threonine-protein kinase, partial [Gemmatimonadales bacterium]|nr:serine/threonine-protein kinase [Gemmatimonadales bacterium]